MSFCSFIILYYEIVSKHHGATLQCVQYETSVLRAKLKNKYKNKHLIMLHKYQNISFSQIKLKALINACLKSEKRRVCLLTIPPIQEKKEIKITN